MRSPAKYYDNQGAGLDKYTAPMTLFWLISG
jgi:hypothetical protein